MEEWIDEVLSDYDEDDDEEKIEAIQEFYQELVVCAEESTRTDHFMYGVWNVYQETSLEIYDTEEFEMIS